MSQEDTTIEQIKEPKLENVRADKIEKLVEIFESRRYVYALGRRKRSSARVRLYPDGKGRMYVNKQEFRHYFPYFELQKIVTHPLDVLKEKNNFDVSVVVVGGGSKGQAESIKHALARALVEHNQDWKPALRRVGALTRDAREKERKKPGLKKARRAPQWSKR